MLTSCMHPVHINNAPFGKFISFWVNFLQLTSSLPMCSRLRRFKSECHCGCRHSSGPRRRVTKMPIGVPKVPYRSAQAGGWQWIDIWNCLVSWHASCSNFTRATMIAEAFKRCAPKSSMHHVAQIQLQYHTCWSPFCKLGCCAIPTSIMAPA